jgi:hypothetical protein
LSIATASGRGGAQFRRPAVGEFGFRNLPGLFEGTAKLVP